MNSHLVFRASDLIDGDVLGRGFYGQAVKVNMRLIDIKYKNFPFCALTLLVGQQEGQSSCKKAGCWFVGGDSLTGALHVL